LRIIGLKSLRETKTNLSHDIRRQGNYILQSISSRTQPLRHSDRPLQIEVILSNLFLIRQCSRVLLPRLGIPHINSHFSPFQLPCGQHCFPSVATDPRQHSEYYVTFGGGETQVVCALSNTHGICKIHIHKM